MVIVFKLVKSEEVAMLSVLKRVPSFCNNIVVLFLFLKTSESFQGVKNSLNMSSLFKLLFLQSSFP